MNVLPSPTTQAAISQVPNRSLAQVDAARPVAGQSERQVPQCRPQPSREQREDAIRQLDRNAEPEASLPLRGRRALAAYNALSQADEQAYMKQVLGFDITI